MSSKINIKDLEANPNPDVVKERANSNVDIKKLKKFFGTLLFASSDRHKKMIDLREKLMKEIEPINYNFYNLDRDDRFDFTFKKSLQYIEFTEKNNIEHPLEKSYLVGPILGTEKQLFSLHSTMVRNSVELWATEEQKNYWLPRMDRYENSVTYAQTELGHGTFVRGLETVVTFDKNTDEFIINSPTITSYKYWPGSLGVTCNTSIVMAKLNLDGVDCGIHAFMVPLRCPETHKPYPNIEIGDIGHKFGFNSQDNGYLAFHNYRIPRFNMFMNFAQVSRDGKFTRTGSEILMYASMLLMRATLCMFGSLLFSMSLTIAVRYSCVRHQTANPEGYEPPVLDYQTQQYRLFPGIAACYGLYFTAFNFRNILNVIQKNTDNLKNILKPALAQLHALSSAIKAFAFDHALEYAQISRLCCGGHGYSASSGLGQIILEADAGCTYEGDNIVLYLQTARYLLKCAQTGDSPHFKSKNEEKLLTSRVYLKYKTLIDQYYQLYDQAINEAGERLLYFIKEKNLSEYEAWNNTSALLVQAAKLYINLFVIMSNLTFIEIHEAENGIDVNTEALINLFELYLLFGMTNKYSGLFLKHNIFNSETMKSYETRLFSLLPIIRKGAISFVDAFDWVDSNLCSTLGCYDGNVYERLLDYARNSNLNKKNPIDQFEKYMKPFVNKQKQKSKL